MKPLVKGFLIGLFIVLIGEIVVQILAGYIPQIPGKIWTAVGMSFGLTYIFNFNMDYKEIQKSTKLSKNKTKFIMYFYSWIVVVSIAIGFNYIWD